MVICGVYVITNKLNGKRYIGPSHNIRNRWYSHRTALRHGSHTNKHLQNAWNKYGEENFEFTVLLQCNCDELIDKEQLSIDSICPEYNMVPFATTGYANKGRKRPDNITRNKTFRSKGHTGCIHSPETRAKMSAAWIERKKRGISDETRAKLSATSKGRKMPPESKEKLRAYLIGHVVTPEMREASAAKQRGRKLSPERIWLHMFGIRMDQIINRKIEAHLAYFRS